MTTIHCRHHWIIETAAGAVSKGKCRICGEKFGVNYHTRCWKHFKVRPYSGAGDPTRCQTQYCHYDIPHKDYIYTEDWVGLLVETLADSDNFQRILGKDSA